MVLHDKKNLSFFRDWKLAVTPEIEQRNGVGEGERMRRLARRMVYSGVNSEPRFCVLCTS